jgi:hypothetical protein
MLYVAALVERVSRAPMSPIPRWSEPRIARARATAPHGAHARTDVDLPRTRGSRARWPGPPASPTTPWAERGVGRDHSERWGADRGDHAVRWPGLRRQWCAETAAPPSPKPRGRQIRSPRRRADLVRRRQATPRKQREQEERIMRQGSGSVRLCSPSVAAAGSDGNRRGSGGRRRGRSRLGGALAARAGPDSSDNSGRPGRRRAVHCSCSPSGSCSTSAGRAEIGRDGAAQWRDAVPRQTPGRSAPDYLDVLHGGAGDGAG